MFSIFKKQTETPKEDNQNSFFNGDIKGVSLNKISYEDMYSTSIQTKPTLKDSGMDSSCYSNGYNPNFDFAINPIMYRWYSSNAFIGFPTMAIIAQNPFIAKACIIPVKDAIRKGWEITCNEDSEIDPKIFTRLKELDKKFNIKKKLINQSQFTKIFGIRVAIFDVESTDPEYYEKPFNLDGVKKGAYRGIKQVDPYWCVPYPTSANLIDPTNLDFYEPTYWMVNGKKFHKSHLVITKGDEVADILKPTYQYAGLSLTQKIYQRLYSSEKLADEVPKLALSKRTNVYKISGISKYLTQMDKFKEKMNNWINLKDNYGVKFADKEDEIQQLDTSLADLDVNIMTQYQLVCSIANIPSYKFLNAPMKGFSSGETEESSYHEYLENIQDYELTPLLDRHYELLIKSYILPEFDKSFKATIKWNELDSIGEKERAEINFIKSQTDRNYSDAGLLLAEDIQTRLIKDETSDFNGIELTKPEEFDVTEYENGNAMDFIKNENGLYFVYSKKGEKLSDGYSSEEEAKKRLQEIEYFKNKGV